MAGRLPPKSMFDARALCLRRRAAATKLLLAAVVYRLLAYFSSYQPETRETLQPPLRQAAAMPRPAATPPAATSQD